MLYGLDHTVVLAAAALLGICIYRWGWVAGAYAALEHGAEKRLSRIEANIERTDGKAESAHAKADRVERESAARDDALRVAISAVGEDLDARLAPIEAERP